MDERRAGRDTDEFGCTNARVFERDASVAGMAICHKQSDPYDLSEVGDYPDALHGGDWILMIKGL